MYRGKERLKRRGQVVFDMVVAVAILSIFIGFFASFISWEIKDMSNRIVRFYLARKSRISGNRMRFVRVNLYDGSSFYRFRKNLDEP